ncbi:MAG: SET domain-containing protein [Okeania sp. SIO2C9]|uniref:SET domain-containing protein-lysine N-methyltransferase n=1 Tax=Okeania sp. SIO2C9 TaxID=2607791 RepID=UPI0013BF1F68|nr:SET domain-containing protein-lysine N-methyltransferase [Okeania sp. SIO2C9]NEQ78288.1 SET domain-containing protein [Okeania sp. SIO2C9]
MGRCTGLAPTRDNYSLQLSDQIHVHLDEPAQLFSHSCDPNAYVKNNSFDGYSFYAAREIKAGEIIAFHYGMTEAYSTAVPECSCNSKNCMGRSIGFKEASPDLQVYLYGLGVANYLRQYYESQN